jgi:predicted NBD/HSP70 family sugar kinase
VRVHTKASRSDTRTQNLRFVLQRIYASGPTTRAELVRETGLTAATISDLVSELVADDIVTEVGIAPSSGGKPPVLVDINANARAIITIDLGGTRWKGSVRNLRLEILETVTVDQNDRTGDDAVEAVISLINRLSDASPLPLLGIGIGTPGVVTDDGVVVEAANLGWTDLPLARALTDTFGVPVHLVNDARATAMAEYLLGDHHTSNLIVVKLGRGVGSGIILNGDIYAGEASAAGEIGHIASIPRGNELVTLESVVSTPAIARSLAQGLGIAFDGRPSKFISAHADDDGQVTDSVIAQIGSDIAAILASVVGTLDVHRIVISGPICIFGDSLLEAINTQLGSRLLPSLANLITVAFGHIDEAVAVESGTATYLMQRELGVA